MGLGPWGTIKHLAIESDHFSFSKNPPSFIFWQVVGREGFHGGSEGIESACNVGDLGLIPGSGRSTGEGNGYPLQCSSLENSKDRGAWFMGVAKSQTQLSN